MRQQGYGDSEKYLKELNWNDWTKLVSGQLDTILSKVAQRFDALSKYASMKGYQVAYDTLQVQAKSANEVKAKLPDITASGMEKLQEKSSKLISNGAKPKVVNNFLMGKRLNPKKYPMLYTQKEHYQYLLHWSYVTTTKKNTSIECTL